MLDFQPRLSTVRALKDLPELNIVVTSANKNDDDDAIH